MISAIRLPAFTVVTKTQTTATSALIPTVSILGPTTVTYLAVKSVSIEMLSLAIVLAAKLLAAFANPLLIAYFASAATTMWTTNRILAS